MTTALEKLCKLKTKIKSIAWVGSKDSLTIKNILLCADWCGSVD